MSKDGPPANSFADPKLKGYLTKQGGQGIASNWRKRFFILDNHYLFYYKSEKDRKPVGVVCLSDYKSCHKASPKESKKSKFTFVIEKGDHTDELDYPVRSYYIFAENEYDMQQWITAISSELLPINKQGSIKVDIKAFNQLSTSAEFGPKLSHPTAARPKPQGRRPPRKYTPFHEDDSKEELPGSPQTAKPRPTSQSSLEEHSPSVTPTKKLTPQSSEDSITPELQRRGHHPAVPLKPKIKEDTSQGSPPSEVPPEPPQEPPPQPKAPLPPPTSAKPNTRRSFVESAQDKPTTPSEDKENTPTNEELEKNETQVNKESKEEETPTQGPTTSDESLVKPIKPGPPTPSKPAPPTPSKPSPPTPSKPAPPPVASKPTTRLSVSEGAKPPADVSKERLPKEEQQLTSVESETGTISQEKKLTSNSSEKKFTKPTPPRKQKKTPGEMPEPPAVKPRPKVRPKAGKDNQNNQEQVQVEVQETPTKQAVTKEDEPVTREEPVTKEEEPVTKKEEPVTKKEEPVTKKEEPVTKKEEPVTKKEEPVTKKEDPVTKKEEPVIKKEEPVTNKEIEGSKEQGADEMAELDASLKMMENFLQDIKDIKNEPSTDTTDTEPKPEDNPTVKKVQYENVTLNVKQDGQLTLSAPEECHTPSLQKKGEKLIDEQPKVDQPMPKQEEGGAPNNQPRDDTGGSPELKQAEDVGETKEGDQPDKATIDTVQYAQVEAKSKVPSSEKRPTQVPTNVQQQNNPTPIDENVYDVPQTSSPVLKISSEVDDSDDTIYNIPRPQSGSPAQDTSSIYDVPSSFSNKNSETSLTHSSLFDHEYDMPSVATSPINKTTPTPVNTTNDGQPSTQKVEESKQTEQCRSPERDGWGYAIVNKKRNNNNNSRQTPKQLATTAADWLATGIQQPEDIASIPENLQKAKEILRLAMMVKAEVLEMRKEVESELALARRERHDSQLMKQNAAEILRMAKEVLQRSS